MSTTRNRPSTTVKEVADPTSTTPSLYQHTFFSREAIAARKALIPALILPIFYNALLLWACLSLFFGSLLGSSDISHIRVAAINLDDGFFGTALIDGIKGRLDTPGPQLQWNFADKNMGNEIAWSRNMVLEEKAWAVLEVSPNTSSHLRDALEHGDSSYNSSIAAALYFASARNQATTLSLTVPAIMDLIHGIISQIAINTSASYIQSNPEQLPSKVLQCPQCLLSPFAVEQVDLVPFSSTVAFGTLSTGLIFLLTFTFNIFTVLRAGAEVHGHIFTIRTMLTLRTVSSLSAYLFLSLMYTLGILAFSVPLTGYFSSHAAGFMSLWMLNFLTMGACGLIMEAVFTVIGMRWAPFFLNIWLITNASASLGTFETMNRFYRYGYAMPFWQCVQATRTIVFGTKSHLGLNFGVLVIWCVVGWSGVVVYTTWRVRKSKRTGVHYVP